MNAKKIGNFIRTLRENKNMTQQQLANLIPISRQAVSKWELGQTLPDHLVLIKLSEIFDITINELLSGEKNPKENITINLYKERKKHLKTLNITLILLVIMSLAFFSYYFINQYNSTKIYKIYTNNDNINITNGLFIETKEKIYFNLGNVETNKNVEKIEIIDKSNDEENIIYSTDTDKILFVDYIGYEEYFSFKNLKNIIKNLYAKFYFDNEEIEIKLKLKKDYINNNIFFYKKNNIDNNNLYDKLSSENNLQLIKNIKEKFEYSNNAYIKTIKKNGFEYNYVYSENTNNLIVTTKQKNDIISELILDINMNTITFYNNDLNYIYYFSISTQEKKCKSGNCEEFDGLSKHFELLLNQIK